MSTPAEEFLPEAINVQRQAGTMEIVWSAGRTKRFNLMQLRRMCPCASCAEARGENPHPGLLEAPTPKDATAKRSFGLPLLGDVKKFQIASMNHVGRYALGVTWEDGHQSIFAWTFLSERDSAAPNR
jgi:DUF971 family protein